MEIIEGDIFQVIEDYLKDEYFVITAHGCNCFCTQGAGIAVEYNKRFNTLQYPLEDKMYSGHYNKLGNIEGKWVEESLYVANCYTQYHPGPEAEYVYLYTCLDKLLFEAKESINMYAKTMIILPYIGCGIGGLNTYIIEGVLNILGKKHNISDHIKLVKYKKDD